MDGRLLYKHSLAVRKPKNVKCNTYIYNIYIYIYIFIYIYGIHTLYIYIYKSMLSNQVIL